MDRKESMESPGSPSFYMHRGVPGSETGSLTSASMPFQSTMGTSSFGTIFPLDTSSAVSLRGGVSAALSAVTQGEPPRRKRGRPRKYGIEGAISLILPNSSLTSASISTPTQKKRGRPPGTGLKQQLASPGGQISNSAGMGFTPHLITISVGEDVTTKITSFFFQGSRSVCVLTANGAISVATLHQPATSSGTITYEGRYEILCLSGSYVFTASGYRGALSVSLASPDGRVIGGGVGGALIAATAIQVILGSFSCGGSNTKGNARETLLTAQSSEYQTIDSSEFPSNVWQSQSPTSIASTVAWHGS